MSTLTQIVPADECSLDSRQQRPFREHPIRHLPVVVIALHEGCNCRCVMCDIWKIQNPRQLPFEKLAQQMDSFEKLGVRWIALTGGEPQRHSHFAEFTAALKSRNIRVSMLTAGVLLEQDAGLIARCVDEVIVSLDGPPQVHDRIRRIPEAFRKLARGIRALRFARPDIHIAARCTVQRANHDALCRSVEAAREIGVDSISFLAADVSSTAFNRPAGWSPSRQNAVTLDSAQIARLQQEVDCLIDRYADRGFVLESPEKLRRIVRHFRAQLGQASAVAPKCNAPWVSAVLEASGEVRPCFFHPAVGTIHENSFVEIVNSPTAIQFRAHLDVASNATCRRCVCSLNWRFERTPDSETVPPVRQSSITVMGSEQELKGKQL